MTAVVVGGSSGLGRALCEGLAARGRDIMIVASDEADCRRLADDLRLRHGIAAWPLAIDARDPTAFAGRLVRALGDIVHDGDLASDLFFPMGVARDDDLVGEGARTMTGIWAVNYAAVVAAIEALIPGMVATAEGERCGRIVGFGSIAAIRARGRNLQYAAAKSALATYFEGLRHALAATGPVVQFYVVGYVESGQSFGKTQLFPAIPAPRAAQRVLNDGYRDFGRRFLPSWWAMVALALKLLPWRLFMRLRH